MIDEKVYERGGGDMFFKNIKISQVSIDIISNCCVIFQALHHLLHHHQGIPHLLLQCLLVYHPLATVHVGLHHCDVHHVLQ